MKRQAVNLYSDDLKPKKEPFQLPVVLAAIAVVFSCLIVASAFLQLRVSNEKQALLELETNNEALLSRVESLATQVAQQQADPEIARQLAQIEVDIEQRNRVLSEMAVLGTTNHGGFSEYLRALAEEVPKGLWLTSISIDLAADAMRLEGGVVNASSVPVYLQNLGEKRVFKGRRFEVFQLSKDKNEEALRFSISTRHMGDPS